MKMKKMLKNMNKLWTFTKTDISRFIKRSKIYLQDSNHQHKKFINKFMTSNEFISTNFSLKRIFTNSA